MRDFITAYLSTVIVGAAILVILVLVINWVVLR